MLITIKFYLYFISFLFFLNHTVFSQNIIYGITIERNGVILGNDYVWVDRINFDYFFRIYPVNGNTIVYRAMYSSNRATCFANCMEYSPADIHNFKLEKISGYIMGDIIHDYVEFKNKKICLWIGHRVFNEYILEGGGCPNNYVKLKHEMENLPSYPAGNFSVYIPDTLNQLRHLIPLIKYHRFAPADVNGKLLNEEWFYHQLRDDIIIGYPFMNTGGTGQFGSALVGYGGPSNFTYVKTNWRTNLHDEWTISFWVNNLPTSSVSKYHLFGDSATTFRCWGGGAVNDKNLYLSGLFNTVTVPNVAPGPSVIHFVYESDSTNAFHKIKAYKNGALVSTTNQPLINIRDSIGYFKIGGYSSLLGLPYNALIDEFRVDARALDSAEIARSWNVDLLIGLQNINTKLPKQFSLYQNYPNPFNPVTNIKFDIPKSSFVKLTVYDILGKQIAVLVNEELKPGAYSADWDAIDLASGIYYYTLEAGDPSAPLRMTKKMVLVK